MSHYQMEQWKAYVNDDLDEKVREVYEEHLYSCDQCLDLYFQVVAEQEEHLPVLSNEADFTNMIMARIEEGNKSERQQSKVKKVPLYQKAIFHYTLAASMTILLMTTGVFQSITSYVGSIQNPVAMEEQNSVTKGIVDKTFAWMDTFDTMNKEADK